MTKQTLAAIKTALADKYERLAKVAGSTPKRTTFANRAAKHRRQAEQLQREGR